MYFSRLLYFLNFCAYFWRDSPDFLQFVPRSTTFFISPVFRIKLNFIFMKIIVFGSKNPTGYRGKLRTNVIHVHNIKQCANLHHVHRNKKQIRVPSELPPPTFKSRNEGGKISTTNPADASLFAENMSVKKNSPRIFFTTSAPALYDIAVQTYGELNAERTNITTSNPGRTRFAIADSNL